MPIQLDQHGAGGFFYSLNDLADPDLRGLRVAVSTRMGCRAPLVDSEVDALVAQAGPLLADAGASVEDASPVWSVDPLEPFEVFWATACASTVDGFAPSKQAQLDPLMRAVAVKGRSTTLAAYQQAVQQRLAISVVATEFFRRFDVLIGPVMPVPAFAVERDVPENFENADWSWCPYTYVWNMTGQPAASVPIGFSAQGLPIGVQIVGRKGADGDVLRAAAAIERRRPLRMRRPATTSIELSKSGRNS